MKRPAIIVLTAVAFVFGFAAGRAGRPSDAPPVDPHAGHQHEAAEGASNASNGEMSAGANPAMPLIPVEQYNALQKRVAENPADLDALLSMFEAAPMDPPAGLMESLGTARKLSWDSAPALARFAGIAIKYGAHPLAYSAAVRIIEIAPKDPLGYKIAGRIAIFYTRDYAAAEKHYTRALELAPNDPIAPMIQRTLEMLRSGEISEKNPLAPPPR